MISRTVLLVTAFMLFAKVAFAGETEQGSSGFFPDEEVRKNFVGVLERQDSLPRLAPMEASTNGRPAPTAIRTAEENLRKWGSTMDAAMAKFFSPTNELNRGHKVAQNGTKNAIPRTYYREDGRQDGYLAVICGGAGCVKKVRFLFSKARLKRVQEVMAEARSSAKCLADIPKCERIGLSAGVVEMEKMVWTGLEGVEYNVQYDSDLMPWPMRYNPSARTQDCVDQATNGMSYVYILAKQGLIRHFHVVDPGETFMHHWTRVADDNGRICEFDLYHRGSAPGAHYPGTGCFLQDK
jgi:hypothetical protein